MARTSNSVPLCPAALSPEWKLLLVCARTRLDDSHRPQMRELLSRPLVWTRFISEVSRHRLGPLATRYLAAEGAGAIPHSAALAIETLARAQSHLSLMHAGRLIELLDLFESAGVTAIPYKGPTLGALAYGNFALRSFVDLDL